LSSAKEAIMRPMPFIPSSGFAVCEPSFNTDGEVTGLKLTEIAAFVAHHPTDAADADGLDGAMMEPLAVGWDGTTPPHPERLVRRPDGWFVDRKGHIGGELDALARFRDYGRRQRRGRRSAGLRVRFPHGALTMELIAT